MRRQPKQPEFLLRFRGLPGEPPPAIRLRRLLKFALRSCGLRCVTAEEIRENPKGSDMPVSI